MKKSFSLVEVLITIMILSLLISTSMFSIKYFIKSLDSFSMSLPYDAINYEKLSKSLKGTYYYVVFKKNELGIKKAKNFYHAKSNSLLFITSNPMHYKSISVAKLYVKNNNLIYEESELFIKEQNYLKPKILNKNKFSKTIRKNVKNILITYLYKDTNNIPYLVLVKINNKEEMIFEIMSNFINHKKFLIRKEKFL